MYVGANQSRVFYMNLGVLKQSSKASSSKVLITHWASFFYTGNGLDSLGKYAHRSFPKHKAWTERETIASQAKKLTIQDI